MYKGLYKSIKKHVIKTVVIDELFLHKLVIKYHNIHIIHALTTDASSHTKKQKITKKEKIKIVLINIGINLNKNHKNIIKIVILNQLTAIICVVQELLKSCDKSFGIFSLAHIKIQESRTDSSLG